MLTSLWEKWVKTCHFDCECGQRFAKTTTTTTTKSTKLDGQQGSPVQHVQTVNQIFSQAIEDIVRELMKKMDYFLASVEVYDGDDYVNRHNTVAFTWNMNVIPLKSLFLLFFLNRKCKPTRMCFHALTTAPNISLESKNPITNLKPPQKHQLKTEQSNCNSRNNGVIIFKVHYFTQHLFSPWVAFCERRTDF